MIPSDGASPLFVFKLDRVIHIQMNNSRFLNMQNTSIVTFDSNNEGYLNTNNENVSMTFSNITVANNNLDIQDNTAAQANLFSFQGAGKQPTIISFVDSYFKDNKVTSSIIKISETSNISLNLTNNTFYNNFGSYGSAIVSITNMILYLNQLWVINNLFEDNHSLKKGAIFSIVLAIQNLTLLNNIYINNSAQQGGVGYTSNSNVMYYEDNGTYIGNITYQLCKFNLNAGNSANDYGGTWYFGLLKQLKIPTPLLFTKTSFTNSSSNQGRLKIFSII